MTKKTKCPAPLTASDDTDLHALINLFKSRAFEAAVPKAAALIKLYPNSPSIWNMYGAALQETGQLDAAMAAFQKAVELAPDNGKLTYNLARLHQKRNEHVKAIPLFNTVVELQPDWHKGHFMLGLSLKKLGHIKDAIVSYTRSAELSPEDARIQNSLGALFEKDDRFEEAAQCFQTAISLRPNYPEAHYNLGKILKALGQPDKAIASYQKALNLKPDFAEAWLNLGNTLYDQERYSDSLRCYNNVIFLRPNDMNALKRRGRALIAHGEIDIAKRLFQDLLSQFPDDPDIHFHFGQIREAQGHINNALGSYSEAYQLDKNHGGAVVALLSAQTGNLSSETIHMLNQSRERISMGLSAEKRLFLKAHVLRHYGDLDGAWENYVQANEVIYSREQELALKTVQDQKRTLALLRSKGIPNIAPHDDDPVSLFILGPSRSGKTMLETVLSTSPHVRRGYENPPFIPMIQESAKAFGLSTTKRLFYLTRDAKEDFLARYRARLKENCKKGRYIFTDTSPHRIFNAWEVANMLPNAFFVFVQRDPLDTAVAIFKTHYQSANHYAYHPMTIYHHVMWYRQVQNILAKQLEERAVIVEHKKVLTAPSKVLIQIEAMLGKTLGCAAPPALPERLTKETAVFRRKFEAMLRRP